MVIQRRILLLLLLCLLISELSAQSYRTFLAGTDEQRSNALYGKGAIPREDGQIVYKEVFPLSGKSQEQVYNRAVNSLGKLFPKYMTRIISQDEANYIIRGEGKFEFTYSRGKLKKFSFPYQVKFYITIECKEGRYRIIMDNFFLIDQENNYVSDASNYAFSDKETLDQHGKVKNTNNGCKRIGIITSYLLVPHYFNEYMTEPVRKKVNGDKW